MLVIQEKKELFWEDRLLAVICIFIGLAEGAHLGAIVRGQSLSVFQKLFFCLFLIALMTIAILILARYLLQKKKGLKRFSPMKIMPSMEFRDLGRTIPLLFFLSLVLLQLAWILFGTTIWQAQDLTLETVVSFLQTGKLYEINPMTGVAYEQGIPTRLKILCLPTLYAALCNAFKTSPETVVWHVVPAVTLLLSYVSYGALGKTLFPESEKDRRVFLAVVALLFIAGSYAYGMEGFGLLYVGFQGTTIKAAVLMPWLLSLCLRRRWILALLTCAAEACITWTLYGLGMGLIIIGVFGAYALWQRTRSGRREAAA